MGIRVPTGVMETTATVQKRDALLFECTKCGERSIFPYLLQSSASGTYHVLQSMRSKDLVREQASNEALRRLYETSAALAEAVNKAHNYIVMDRCVICPHCGHRQEWSAPQIKKPRNTSSKVDWRGLLWMFGLLLAFPAALFVLVMALDAPVLFIPIGLIACAVGVLCLLQMRKKRKRQEEHRGEITWFIEECRAGRLKAPVYYNELNGKKEVEEPRQASPQDSQMEEVATGAGEEEKGKLLELGQQLLQEEYAKQPREKVTRFLYGAISDMYPGDLERWNDRLLLMAYAYLTAQAPGYVQARNAGLREAIYQTLHRRMCTF